MRLNKPSNIPKVNPSLCIGCGACRQVCPQKAIVITFGKAYIDRDRCIGCLECAKVCPRGAISPEKIQDYSFHDIASSIERLKREIGYLKQRINVLSKKRNKL